MTEVTEQLVKSKERVRDLAEVYTPTKIVDAMLALPGVKEASEDIWSTFLEPACGNGNFIVAILQRKLDSFIAANPRCRQETFEFSIIAALTTVYGIDICRQNVKEARARIAGQVKEFYLGHRGSLTPSEGFYEAVEAVLEGTIVLGNALEGASTTTFTAFIPERNGPAPKPGRKDGRSFSKRFRTQKHTLQAIIDEQLGVQEQLTLVGPVKHEFPITAPVHFLELGTMALVEEAA